MLLSLGFRALRPLETHSFVGSSLIAIESLHDLEGIDQGKVNAVASSVRQAHTEGTAYLASLIGACVPPVLDFRT